MKLHASFLKALKEGIREWKVLAFVLLFAPFFVFLMKMFYGGGPTTYHLGIINMDKERQSIELIDQIKAYEGEEDQKEFQVSILDKTSELEKQVKDKTIDAGIIIPKDYSKTLSDHAAKKSESAAVINIYGSLSNAKYSIAAVLANNIIINQGVETAKIVLPASIKETFLEKKQAINEFDGYVPGLISLSVLMMLFTATASIVKENDKKTLIRLKMSRLGSVNFLAGISIVQAIIAVLAIILTYWTALLFGYKAAGSFFAVLIVGIISSLSMVAMSLIIASFLNTVFDVLTIGCFPFFIFMFFSGCMFPLPKMNLFHIAGKSFGVTDLLSLTHTATAFNKILNYGVGLSDISFELLMITILSVIYFVIGVVLYQKRKLSKA